MLIVVDHLPHGANYLQPRHVACFRQHQTRTSRNADALATIDRCLEIAKRVCVDSTRVVKTIGDEVYRLPLPTGGSGGDRNQLRMCKQRTRTTLGDDAHRLFIRTIEDESDVFGDAVNVAAADGATGGLPRRDAAELSLRARGPHPDSHTVRGKERTSRCSS
jgi:hypothetical protein